MKHLKTLVGCSVGIAITTLASALPKAPMGLEPSAPRVSKIMAGSGAFPDAPLMLPELCYAPGTSPDVVSRNARQQSRGSSLQSPIFGLGPAFQFSDAARWTTTATDGSGLTQGQVTTLTWNIVPDGTPIGALGGIGGESTAASNLRAFLDGIYGNEAAWIAQFQTVFDQWGALTGVTYVKIAQDDGVSLATQPGVVGVRADVRISGHFIDGNSNVLAYNFFPTNGDMVIDTGDNFYSGSGLANGSLGFRNMLAHEHGHGLGFSHSCPVNQTKLMEPFVSTAFVHAQLDDKLAGWRGYGDDKENNETSGTATNLGALGNGTTTLNDVSLDDDSDVDFYRFTVPLGKRAAVTVTPIGSTYLAGPQVSGVCTAGVNFDALAINDIGVELRGTDGTTVLASANVFGAGAAESISSTGLGGAGTFFVRAFAGAVNNVQGYQLQVTISDDVGSFVAINDVTLTEGTGGTTNAVFTVTRSGVTTGSVSVTAQTANLTATSPADYTATGPTVLTFGSGVTTQTFSVAVAGDALDETNETYLVNLTSPSGVTIADGQGIGTINDDDNPPTLSINDVAVNEGNSGTANASFTASLSAASGQTVTANFATANGTAGGSVSQTNATALSIPSSGNASLYPSTITVAGASGTVSKVTASLNGFSHTYPQDVDVLLVGPAGQKIVLMSDVGGDSDASGVTLVFDDAAPANLTSGAVVAGSYKPTNIADGEGADAWGSPAPAGPYGSTLADFVGTAPNGSWSLFVVDDTGGDAGSLAGGWTLTIATTGQDYTSVSGTVSFAPGQTTQPINVPVLGDTSVEPGETFFVNLTTPINATILDGQGLGTINNDDGASLCAAGTFSANGSSIPVACAPASAGNFVPSAGATSQTPCSAGSFQPLQGQTSCTPASAGSFVSGIGAATQVNCSPGFFQPLQGQTSCTPASAGSFVAGSGAIAQANCSAGTFTSATAQTICTLAPAGSFVSAAGATSATPCAPGSFQTLQGQTSCLPAAAGSFVAGSGAISSTPCSPGFFQPVQGQTSCTPAGAGSFVSGTGAIAQVNCSPGTFTNATAQTICTQAPAGSFVPGAGATTSTPCSPGSFQPIQGQTSCTPASAGSFVSGSGATGQVNCSPGFFQPLQGQTSCTPAGAGSFVSGTGAIAQVNCSAGTFTNATAQTICTQAPAGSFVPGAGATTSTPCSPGSFQPIQGQTSCTPASPNFFVPASGATSQTPCAPGLTSPAGATACVAPAARTFVSEAGSDSNSCSVQTTPCRNLAAAIALTAPEGEVIILTAGEYETAPLTISQGVKITSPSGTVAFIRQPVTVNAPGARVVLRGLTIKGTGAGNGVTLIAAGSLSIEETTIDRWGSGLRLNNPAAARIFLMGSVLQNNTAGILASAAAAGNAVSVHESRFEKNGNGLEILVGTVQVRGSAFTGNTTSGVTVGPGSVDIRNSEFSVNGTAVMALSGGLARFGSSWVFGNTVGLSAAGGSTFNSYANNVIRGNATNTVGTITAIPQQ